MKYFHLSDLHIGKRVNEYSMIEDQEYILQQILSYIDEEQPNGILLAGDLYDKSVPSAEAVTVFDQFLVELTRRNIPVFAISGNHDSPERIAFGRELFQENKLFLSPVYQKGMKPIQQVDSYGEYYIYLLPFIKPTHVRQQLELEVSTYTEALQAAIADLNVDSSQRNILVTHQFVSGGERSDSEDLSIGGSDNVDASVFAAFDYVALGHLHRPQNVGSKKIRYCGSPLKYSFSESSHNKSITVVELKDKNELSITELPLNPLHDLCEYRGTFHEFISEAFKSSINPLDYIHLTLTDDFEGVNVLQDLRQLYPNLMKVDYDNERTKSSISLQRLQVLENQTPYDLIAGFYEGQNGSILNEKQQAYVQQLIDKIWGD